MKIGLLLSGNLGAKVLDACLEEYSPLFIGTDSNSQRIIESAKESDIPLFTGNPRNGRLDKFLGETIPDVILSINYLFLLDKSLIRLIKYPINFHGSLLPKYRGRTPHVWSIINNELKAGVTAHIIDEGCDTGDVILQKEIKILPDDTGNDVLNRYQLIYPVLVKTVLQQIESNTLKRTAQDDSLATYFPKRTPEDGEIQWHWHKERIKNWIRAQAFPYPGAFTKYNEHKIVIDRITISEHGYSHSDPNGLILSDNPNFIVKTPNGAIELLEIREGNDVLKKGLILGI